MKRVLFALLFCLSCGIAAHAQDGEAAGASALDAAQSLNERAMALHAQGRFDQAEPLYRRVLEMVDATPGWTPARVDALLTNLASVYDAQGKFALAEPLYKRRIALEEKTLGPEDPELARTLADLALLYHNMRRLPEAEPLYLRALAIREKALGADHRLVVSTLVELKLVYVMQRKFAQAVPIAERVLAIEDQAPGGASARTLDSVAFDYRQVGRNDEATMLEKRAAALRAAQRAGR